MNYDEAIRKPFTDLGKLAIGIVLGLIPIVNWVARGFALECSGAGRYKFSKGMPEWKDVWYYFTRGLASYVIAIVYAIPAIAVFSITAAYAAGSLASLSSLMPGLGSMPSLITEQFFRTWVVQNWSQVMQIILAMAPMLTLGIALLALGMYFYPVGVLNYLKTKEFAKAFDFRVVKATAFSGRYFWAWIISGVIAIVISAVANVIPILGSSVAFFVSGVIAWDLYGQAFAKK
jgi:hypothetical protein